jgi:hypothetical protein
MTITPEHAALIARIQPCDLLRLDMTALGDHVARLPVISRQLGHASVLNTVKDYLAPHPAPTLEGEFVRDLFTKDPETMARRWYGSDANAGAFWSVFTADVLR